MSTICFREADIEIPPATVEQDTWSFRSEIRSLSELSTLKSQQFKQISLTQDFGAVLNVYVQEFIPVDRDQTVYVHVLSDGSTSRLQMPNFALAQLEDTKNAMNRFVSDTLDIYLENYLDSGNDIMWSIFQLAIRRARWQNVRASHRCEDQLMLTRLRIPC